MSKETLHIAMLVDAWFPSKARGIGVFGGGQVHVQELKNRLERDWNYRVTLFYPAHPNILFRALWSLYVIYRIMTTHQKNPFTLIHSHGFNSGFPAKCASLLINVPVIHTVHGSHLMDQTSRSPQAWLEKVLLTKIKYDAQISVAHKFLEYPNVNHAIDVIPNGVNINEFDQIKVEKHKHPTIIWVGRQDKVKGLEVLKKALIKVRRKIPHAKVNLITGGKVHGKALIKAYKRAHVFVLSSLAEGQPITLLEAWAAKLPVVVTAVGDNPKMVVDDENGYLVEPGNVKQLADALVKVLRAREKNKRMGQKGYELVKSHYTWEIVTKETVAVYQKVMSAYDQRESKQGLMKRLKGRYAS